MRRNLTRSLVPVLVAAICIGVLFVLQTDDNDLFEFGDTLDKKDHFLSDIPKSEILLGGSGYSDFNGITTGLSQCKTVKADNLLLTTSHAFDTPAPSIGLNIDNKQVTVLNNRFLEDGQILSINLYSNYKFAKKFGKQLNTISVTYEDNKGFDVNVKGLLGKFVANSLLIVVAM